MQLPPMVSVLHVIKLALEPEGVHVPPVIVILEFPVKETFIVIPLVQVKISDAVLLRTPAAVLQVNKVTLQLPLNVFMADEVNVKGAPQVTPPEVIVEAADIVNPLEPAQVPAVLSVKFPATVKTALLVIVPVYPEVLVKDRIVIVAEIVAGEAVVSKNTSSVDVGTDWLPAPPDDPAQFVLPVAFQLTLEPPPTQYLEALCTIIPSSI